MYYLIVTDDEKLANKAKAMGAAVFVSNQSMVEAAPVASKATEGDPSKAYELLRKLGIKPNIKGYYYLKWVMEKCESIPGYNQLSITKEIYPDCAKEFNTTPARVERSIRHAIGRSFEDAPERYSATFGDVFTTAPTNSEFIGMISEYFANIMS